MTIELEWVMGFVFALIAGGYGWTVIAYTWLSGRIDLVSERIDASNMRTTKIEDNHLKHIEARLDALEAKQDWPRINKLMVD